ncbi:MAG TPA: hypothetical protein PLS67_14435, partial [Accumulibacter sp.]|nr:hypothetical protein [Accumulibacter sp.]
AIRVRIADVAERASQKINRQRLLTARGVPVFQVRRRRLFLRRRGEHAGGVLRRLRLPWRV